MSRGIIYHVTTNPDDLFTIDAADFTGQEQVFNVKNFSDRTNNEATQDILRLVNSLREAGFNFSVEQMKPYPIPFDYECPVYILTTGNWAQVTACKENYFRPLLERLKTEVQKTNLTVFATDPLYPVKLQRNLNDNYSDVICLSTVTRNVPMPVHTFIRELEPETRYYIDARTVLMD